jgi:hypothetical protein
MQDSIPREGWKPVRAETCHSLGRLHRSEGDFIRVSDRAPFTTARSPQATRQILGVAELTTYPKEARVRNIAHIYVGGGEYGTDLVRIDCNL